MVDMPQITWMKKGLPQSLRTALGVLLFVALLYGVARISLLLTVPPGNVSVLWLPAGLGFLGLYWFGKRYWYGILIASLAVNVGFFLDQQPTRFWLGVFIALGIALGSSLQAVIAQHAVRHGVLSRPKALGYTATDLIKALMVAGPLCSMIGATIGTLALLLGGHITAAKALTTALSWWFGDTAGVMMLGGVGLWFSLLVRPKTTMNRGWLSASVWSLMPLMGVGVVIVVTLSSWWMVRTSLQQQDAIRFEHQARFFQKIVNHQLQTYEGMVGRLALLGQQSDLLLNDQFTASIANHYPAIIGLVRLPVEGASSPHHSEVPSRNFKWYFHASQLSPQARTQLEDQIQVLRFIKKPDLTLSQSIELSEIKGLGQQRLWVIINREYRQPWVILVDPEVLIFAMELTDQSDMVYRLQGLDRSGHLMILYSPNHHDLAQESSYRATYQTQFFNKPLAVTWQPTQHFFTRRVLWGLSATDMILLGGALKAVLLGALLLSLNKLRQQALQQVEMTKVALSKAQRSLKQSEERLELALEATQDGVWDWNLKTNEVYFSPRWMTMLGYDPDHWPQTFETFDKLLHREDRATVEAALEAHFMKEVPFEVQIRLKTQGDGWKWVLSRGTIVAWDDNDYPVRMIGTHLDLDVQKQTEGLLVEAKEAAERTKAMQSQFLATMSHEIRTPLNGVLGMTTLLKDTPLNGEQQEYVSLIQTSGQLLLTVVNDVLDFSKMEAGKLHIESQPFSIPVWMQALEKVFTSLLVEKPITLNVLLDSSLPEWVAGDKVRLSQVFHNLVSNAIKFTEHGQISIGVERVSQTKDTLTLRGWVKDTGIGISEAEMDQIFHPFVQADGSTARKYGGTGLGLSICRNLAEAMGGQLRVESQVNVGSQFSFTAVVTVAEQPVSKEAPAVGGSMILPSLALEKQPASGGPYMILLVEDNQTNAVIATRMLRKLGYDVLTACQGKEAVALWETQPIDLILMDLHMPEMDGFEATEAIRHTEAPSGVHVPIVALTADVLNEVEQRCEAAGMDGYLSKPLDREQMHQTIQHLLERYPQPHRSTSTNNGPWPSS